MEPSSKGTIPIFLQPVTAPVSGWRRLLGDWALVGGAEIVCQVLGTVTSLLLRMLLSPAQMGIWQAVKLFLSYGNYANFGISKGAAREFTVAMGRGDTAQAERGLDLAFTVNSLSSLIYAAILIGAGFWVAVTSDGPWSFPWTAGLIVGGILAVLGRYVSFQVTILRSQQAFATTSRFSMVEAALTLVVGGLATWVWGLAGLYAGTLAVMLVSLAYLSKVGTLRLRWRWDAGEMRRLMGIGGPIMLAGAIFTLFRSLDKLMILAYMHDREFQLGCYSLALLISTQLYGIGNMLSVAMGPRYGEKLGQSGDRRQVALLAARASELQAAAMALPAGVAMLIARPVLGLMLPEYQAGLAPLVWLLPSSVLLSLTLPTSQYLIAVDRQGRALAAVTVATGLAAVGNHVALIAGYGLVGVAAATALGHAVYYLLILRISIWAEFDWAQRWRYMAMLGLAIVPTVGLAALFECTRPAMLDWSNVVAGLVAVVLGWSISVHIGWRYGRWGEAVRREA